MLLASITLFVLAACSNGSSVPEPSDIAEFSAVALVDISAGIGKAELEALHGGSAIVFRPEAGFAVLGFSEAQAALTTLATDPSENVFAAPEITAAGVDAWAGGVDAWAGGVDAWAGGFDAWAGGFDAWAGGVDAWAGGNQTASTFSQNLDVWDRINLPEAQAKAPNLGSGIKVAVLDTGIDLTHPAFAGKLAPASEWKDFVDGDRTPQEAQGSNYGHGTGVAGIILQVAPNATILPIRVLDGDGVGDTDDIVAAMDFAIQKGADVINLSLGATQDVAALRAMVDYANSLEVAVVASAGNTDSQSLTYPANYAPGTNAKFVFGVGSVNTSDVKSPFSNYGGRLELVAPGERLYTVAPDAGIGYWSGTSFSAPIVSGALALGFGDSANRMQFSNRLVGNGARINDANREQYEEKLGKRLNIKAAFGTWD